MKFIPVCLFSASIALVHAQFPGSAPIPAQYKKGVSSITIDDAKSFLGYLAGPETEGRGTMQPGFKKAAEYMAARFKEFGLKPVGDNGTYFQNVRFARAKLRPADSGLKSADGTKTYAGEGQIGFGRLNKSVDLLADVVFLRFTSTDGELIPQSANLRGKLVFVVSEKFPPKLREEINKKQPLGIVRVTDQVFQGTGSDQRPVTRNLSSITVVESAAAKIAEELGVPAGMVDKGTEQAGRIRMVEGKGKLKLVARFDETDTYDVPNVVAYLEGTDPRLKQELVGIGAHLDHLGKRGDVIYYGADDDGSGSAALLQVAKAFQKGGMRPKRSILFMAFCGEEMGLLGSGFYSDNPIFPHSNMVAELQMDMVGRDSDGVQNGDPKRVDKRDENYDTIRLVGSKRISTDLHNIVLEHNKHIGFKFKWDAEDVYTRSDHYNFAKVGIPIAFLFDGFHPDYHRPTDTVDKINFVKLTNAAKLYYMVALDLANRKERPRHDVLQTPEGG